jgi:hypothetical protein
MDSRQGTDFRRPVLYGARAFVRAEKPNCGVNSGTRRLLATRKFESRSRHFKYQQARQDGYSRRRPEESESAGRLGHQDSASVAQRHHRSGAHHEPDDIGAEFAVNVTACN